MANRKRGKTSTAAMPSLVLVLAVLLLMPGSAVRAQVIQTDTLSGGSILVSKDVRFDMLVKKQADYNEKANLTRKYSHGFRLQVISTTDRNEAISAKTKLLQLFPGEKVYLTYLEPYFKIRFGNFRNHNDADEFQKQVEKLYPGVFVIPSAIEPKPEWFKEPAEDGQN